MQRHGFGGQPATQGCSLAHRSLGSTGMNTTPGKVFKGKRMHGRGGNKLKTRMDYQVYKIDVERCLVYVLGNVAGSRGITCKIRDSLYKERENHILVHYPTF